MYINDTHIVFYFIIGILGLLVGRLVAWMNKRLPEYKKVFSREMLQEHKINPKCNLPLMIITVIIYIALLYRYGIQSTFIENLNLIKFMILTPMLLSAFVIDYKLQIIPNRLTLTIFEFGLIFTFAETLLNTNAGINIFINNLLGMITGGGIFLLITLIGGLLAGKEAMGFRRCKIDGSIRAFLWMA